MAIKILIGGSPCTHWSIAQKNNRETTAEGIGWELFKNYLIAKEKFKPDLFLYENNKSAAQAIKDQIAFELGVGTDPKARFTYINSALVSAQNRQRFYVTNFGEIEQPEDRGILLKDILETGTDLTQNEKSYCLTASYNGACAWNTIERSQRSMVAEPVNITADGKSQCLRATCYKDGIRNLVANDVDRKTCVAEPVCMRYKRNEEAKRLRKQYEAGEVKHGFNEHSELHPRTDGKSNTLSTVLKDNPICEPVACRVRGRKDSNGDGYARYECRNDSKSNTLDTNTTNGSMVAEPVCVAQRGRYTEDGRTEQQYEARTDGKTNAITTVQKDNSVAEPVGFSMTGTFGSRNASVSEKAYCLAANPSSDMSARVIEPIRTGCYPSPDGTLKNSQGMRLYSIEGKSVNLTAQGGGMGAKTGLYAIPVPYQCAELSNEYYHGDEDGQLFGKIECDNSSNNKGQPAQGTRIYCTDCKSICLDGDSRKYIVDTLAIPTEFNNDVPIKAVSCADGKEYPVYQVLNGQITIKNKQYPIKLQDGYYIIRKLTVIECCRLQTMPDSYCKVASATQGYKGLGNGWTAEVIIHLFNHALKDVPRNEEIVVLSLYDGIGTGRYCLEKMGFTNVTYHAYEIDKYPMAIATDNFPDIIQHGDAFAVREDDWQPPQSRSDWLDELLGGDE